MNSKTKSSGLEVRLGSLQVVVLLGIILGGMGFAFYLGFYSGQNAGFNLAQSAAVDEAVRLPIADASVKKEVPEANKHEQAARDSSEVYAKLGATDKVPEVEQGALEEDASAAEQLPSAHALESHNDDPLAEGTPTLGDIPGVKVLGSTLEHKATDVRAEESRNVKPSQTEFDAHKKTDSELEKGSGHAVAKFEGKTIAVERSGSSRVLGGLEPEADEPKSVVVEKKQVLHEVSKRVDQKEASRPAEKIDSPKIESAKAVVRETAIKPSGLSEVNSPKTSSPAIDKEVKKPSDAQKGGVVRVTAALPKGWFAQVAAPRKQQDAQALAGKLKQAGFPVLIEQATVKGEEYFRVVVGPETGRPTAERLIEQIRREKVVANDPFIRAVK